MTWCRPVSPVERVWLVAADLFPSFGAAVVLEGDGALDAVAWREAVASASRVTPGLGAVVRGAACRLRWEEAGPLPVREVDGTRWSGRDPEGAPFLKDRLDPTRGPAAELLLAHGPTPRVVLRALHAVSDGGGMVAFLHDVCRVLRGEAPVGHAQPACDLDVARRLTDERRPAPPRDALAPTGAPDGPPGGVAWRRVTVPTRPSQLLGRLAVALAAEARRHAEGPVRLEVPADLRRVAPEVRSTANLSGSVVLDVPAGSTPAGITDDLRAQLAAGRQASRALALAPVVHVPLTLLQALGRRQARKHLDAPCHEISAVVSNMGLAEPASFEVPGFAPRAVFFVPPLAPVTAAFVALGGSPAGVELTVAVPDHLATGCRLERLIGALAGALEEREAR